ncbi:MAG: hypothetical protein QNI88_13425 [Desulfobacterales bacterium]|nr:hypothetical protein [Desulfobacterales bacterium]
MKAPRGKVVRWIKKEHVSVACGECKSCLETIERKFIVIGVGCRITSEKFRNRLNISDELMNILVFLAINVDVFDKLV